jgi:hypothetical protein
MINVSLISLKSPTLFGLISCVPDSVSHINFFFSTLEFFKSLNVSP